jgi:MFS family permease
VAALLALSMMAGNALVSWFTRFCGRRTTMLLWTAAVFGSASALVGLAGSFGLALAALLVSAVAMGVQMPVRQAFIHELVPSEARATVVSFDSMISGVGAVGGQAGLGVLADRESYSAGYVVGGLVTLVAFPLVWTVRRIAPPADFFAGSASEEPAGCVPAGIPAIANVEAVDAETLESA